MRSKFVRNLSYLILLISLTMFGFLIFKDLNWVLGDDDLFLKTTMLGKPSHAWTGLGRFFPVGLCDYSILLLLPKGIGQTIEAHFVYNIIIMTISVFVLFYICNKVNQKNYGLSLFFLLVLFCVSSFLQLHMSCIYPERFMFFLQVLFISFWGKGREKQKGSCYFLAWLFCSCLIFAKEPVFASVLVVALTNLIFGWKQLTGKDVKFHMALAFSSLTYLGIYVYRLFYRNGGDGLYGGGRFIFSKGVDSFGIIKSIFCGEPILFLIFAFAFVRGYYVLIRGDKRVILSDSLLFGAVVYVVSYIVLGMTFSYYSFPAIVCSFPAIIYWTDYYWNKNKIWAFLLTLLFCSVSWFGYNNSKNFTHQTYRLRNNDMNVVEYITDSYVKGKYVYFFMNERPLNQFVLGAVHGNIWEFDVYTHFTNYMLWKKNYLRDKNILRPLEKLEYVFDDSIVMCPENMNQKYKDYLKSRGFSVKKKAFNIDVYSK